jgi:hypothetical protein
VSSIKSSNYHSAVSFGKDIEEENNGLGSLIGSIDTAIRIFKWGSRLHFKLAFAIKEEKTFRILIDPKMHVILKLFRMSSRF